MKEICLLRAESFMARSLLRAEWQIGVVVAVVIHVNILTLPLIARLPTKQSLTKKNKGGGS
jgi:hypothetical protein